MTMQTIYLVDNDASGCHKLSCVLENAGYSVRSFPSAESFLEQAKDLAAGVMLLDQHLAGMSGMELQAELTNRGMHFPIIFFCGQADLQMSVKAIKGGAINFLVKPVKNKVLLESVREGTLHVGEMQIRNVLRNRYVNMTNREREVMQHVVAGMSSKNIAKLLSITERTVETHRSRVMIKMGVKSLPELVRIYYKYSIYGLSASESAA
jgi:two-component system response regulator FixJ